MEFIIDYSKATDRINKALLTLKNELMELRSQDVELMRQLLHINDTIKELSPKPSHYVVSKRLPYRGGIQSCIGLNAISTASLTELPHQRLQSVPDYYPNNMTSYHSSVDDLNTSTDSIFESDSDLDISHVQKRHKSPNGLFRAHSVSLSKIRTSIHVGKLVDDNCYEEMLKRNIKLWKCALAGNRSREPVFHESEAEHLSERQLT